ncbi:MAG: hypothetical protein BIFFINMI_01860 [Phycisphaerae bacterium]|nr:hypothetical protein [Phycisphaerae bacterium]
MSSRQRYAPDADRLRADWRVLCRQIGERRAGTAGERRAADFMAAEFESAGLDTRIETFPCTSLRSGFPFAVMGVPTANFGRDNMPGGRWQHHSIHDNLGHVSAEPVCAVLAALAPVVDELARTARPPFDRDREADLSRRLRKGGRKFCGM